jgi:uncharacterized membrane protein
MKKINLMLSLFVVLISLINFTSAHVGEDEGLHHEICGMGIFFGWIFMILIFIALILLIIWLIKQIQRNK